MASIGASIVFLGLVLLSFAVSQIHRLLELWENRAEYSARIRNGSSLNGENREKVLPREAMLAIKQLQLLTERLGVPFPLPKLVDLSEKTGMKHPYAMTHAALAAGIIVPDKKGYFTWDQSAFDKKISE